MKISTKTMVLLAVLSGLAYVAMVLLRVPVMTVPPFLKFDPKDVVIVITGFLFGPLHAFIVITVVSFVEMVTVSETGWIGLVMNIISSAAFVCPAAVIYQRKRTLAGAVTGLITGCISMTCVMLLWNYILTPLYIPNVTREAVAKMLLPVFLPFNAGKSIMNAAITMLLYKPVVKALRKSGMYHENETASSSKAKLNISTLLVSAFLILSIVLLFWILWG